MRKLSEEGLWKHFLDLPAFSTTRSHFFSTRAFQRNGTLLDVGTTVLKACLPWAMQGELCEIMPLGLKAEVVSVQGQTVFLSPYSETTGLKRGMSVVGKGEVHQMPLGAFLKGQVVNGLGMPFGAEQWPEETEIEEWRPLNAYAPDPLKRQLVTQPLSMGVKSIDGLLTCGQGQRIGIFAAAGGGKSTLLAMMAQGTAADIVVLALVGERGREVREFLEVTLSEAVRQHCVIVVSTSDRCALERMKATFTATTIAEYFRDQGLKVLLMVDSLTRYARAAREIGLASGEPPVSSGFPPSVFATLPRLLERSGAGEVGSITAIYTVLVEGDNMNEPVADEVRSILDGHIILSRKLAQANHYPAIDVNASVSRVMPQITDPQHLANASKFRTLLSTYQDLELLIRVGEFKPGQDPLADESLKRWPILNAYLQQKTNELLPYADSLQLLDQSINGPC